ncbi:Gfo/Idh/MocA family protein [Arthrobacter agilis]|uniref:Gfo/Idh/MocA family protein n=1 Tax=Arthrobacter agilis TaxID=37921 RepID=UPI0027848512|nr:Gfo/Idh/MocA family oxidoreductase [Arthrobacter agilis]MDQ0735721.1 putative dehydrogenase [Arthrobacter agilis]
MPLPSPAAASTASSATPLRAAILGTGGVAHLHARALRLLPGVELVAAADPSEQHLAAFAEAYGVDSRHASLEDMLADVPVDVLHICTPPGGHAEQTAAGFGAGAHVVVEKPAALSLTQLDTMVEVGRAARRGLAVVFQQRSGTAAAHVKGLLDSGAFGRTLSALCQTNWYRTAEYFAVPWRGTWATEGGGTTLSHGSHQVDLLAYLLGEWSAVHATMWRLGRDVETEDLSHASLVFASGAVASVVTTVLAPRESSLLRIDTANATIELEHLYGHGHANWRITPAPHVDEQTAASWALPDQEVPSGHDALFAEIYGSLLAGRGMPGIVGHPARALEIVTAMYASVREGRWISRADLADPAVRGALTAPVVEGRPEARPDGPAA